LTAAALLPVMLAGCEASVQTRVETKADVEVQDFDKPLEPGESARAQNLVASPERAAVSGGVLLGARHDLRLASAGSATCQCLAAALGTPEAPIFSWQSEKPSIDATTQLVIALGSEGIPCDSAPEGSLGASYWGYKVSGADVIVVVEPAWPGRPITRGAIIPKPVAEGQVYVEPVAASSPYGSALGKSGARCALGNPGPRRAASGTQARSLDLTP
jgi:hypothetical protein